MKILTVGCLLATMLSTLKVYPHQLAYFNEAAGGPENGHKHLLHSNLDWGQDLLFLKEWLAKTNTKSVMLDLNLTYNPIALAVPTTHGPFSQQYCVISVNQISPCVTGEIAERQENVPFYSLWIYKTY